MKFRWLNKLMARNASRRSTVRSNRPAQPRLECLEDRCVPSASPFLAAGTAFPSIGDDSQPGVIITIGAGGKVTKTVTGQSPYDGIEDTYVGVVNQSNSGVVLKNLTLSGSDIFGLDADGIQTYGEPASYTLPPLATPYYTGPLAHSGIPLSRFHNTGTTPITGYEGPGNYFFNINTSNFNSGEVIFDDGNGNGMRPGQETYFSLEETPTSVQTATINAAPVTALSLLSTGPVTYHPASNTASFTVPIANISGKAFSGSVSIIFNSTTQFNEPGLGKFVQAFTPQSSVQLQNAGGRLSNGDPFLTLNVNIPAGGVVFETITFSAGLLRGNALGAFTIPGFSMQLVQAITVS